MALVDKHRQRSLEQLRESLAARFPGAGITRLEASYSPNSAASSVSPRPRDSLSAIAASASAPEPLPTHGVVEVVGSAGQGGSTRVLSHLAGLLAVQGRYAAWIDLAHTLYPPAAASLGVPMDRLLMVRTSDLALSLRAAEVILRGGAVRAVVMDMPASCQPLRLAAYHRLRRHARASGVGLIVLAERSLVPADHRVDLRESAPGRVASLAS